MMEALFGDPRRSSPKTLEMLSRRGELDSSTLLEYGLDLSRGAKKPQAAVVGPSTSPWIDPGAASLAHLMSKRGGELYLIDPKSDAYTGDSMHPDPYFRVTGAGNADSYQSDLTAMRNIGISLITPKHVEAAHALNFCISRPLHLIVDHATTLDLVRDGAPGYREVSEKREELVQFYAYDWSQLSSGGRLLVFSHDQKYGFYPQGSESSYELIDILHESGFSEVTHLHVNERYRFSVPHGSLSAIREHAIQERFLDMGYFDPSRDYAKGYPHDQLVIPIRGARGVQHFCPDAYVAVKS